MSSISLDPGRKPALLHWLATGLLVILVAWAYWPGRGGGFTFDDIANIVANPGLHVSSLRWDDWVAAIFSAPSGVLQRPVAMLSFAVNHYFTGLDPMPMKLTNIGIHVLNTLLVLGLVRALCRCLPAAQQQTLAWAPLVVSALWALNPINVMAVLYVVQRMESLAHTFVFAGLWMYLAGRSAQLAGRTGAPLAIAGLVLGTGLGVFTKESAAMLPVYAGCAELVILQFRGRDGGTSRPLMAAFVVLLVLPAIYLATVRLPGYFHPGAYANRDFTVFERLLTESRILLDYLQWTIMPRLGQLGLFHDDYVVSQGLLAPTSTLLAILGLALLLAAAVVMRHTRRLASLGIAWYFAAHVMTATVIPLELVFEHRNYFASLGVCLVLVDLAWIHPPKWLPARAGITCLAALLVLYAGTTRLRSVEWSDPLRFAASEAAKHPRSARATYELARLLVIQTGFRRDSPSSNDALGALDAARRAPRSNLLPLQLSLIYAARTGQPSNPAWWTRMQQILRTKPLNTENRMALIAMNDCAVAGDCVFPPDQMIATFSAALSRSPDAGMLSVYGKYALHVLHDGPLALNLWREAARNGPRNAQFQVNLAMLATAAGRFDEAQQAIDRLRQKNWRGTWTTQAAELQVELDQARTRHGGTP